MAERRAAFAAVIRTAILLAPLPGFWIKFGGGE